MVSMLCAERVLPRAERAVSHNKIRRDLAVAPDTSLQR